MEKKFEWVIGTRRVIVWEALKVLRKQTPEEGLLIDAWRKGSDCDFHLYLTRMVRLYEANEQLDWLATHPHLMIDPRHSAREGSVDPDINLMPFRITRFRDNTIFVFREDINELIEGAYAKFSNDFWSKFLAHWKMGHS